MMSGQRGRPFKPGNQMGQGRPRGSRNKKSITADRLLAEYAESIVKKIIVKALQGDPTAMRLCMERLSPPEREARIKLKTPMVKTVEGVKQALATVIAAVGREQISPSQGEMFGRLLEAQRRGIESLELEQRIEKLEDRTTELKDK
jgi:hypothetical protein